MEEKTIKTTLKELIQYYCKEIETNIMNNDLSVFI